MEDLLARNGVSEAAIRANGKHSLVIVILDVQRLGTETILITAQSLSLSVPVILETFLKCGYCDNTPMYKV